MMSRTSKLNFQLPELSPTSRDVLAVAAWFGLISGFIEGVIYLILQSTGAAVGVSAEILWISPLVNFLIFLGVGAGLAGVGRLVRRLPVLLVSTFLFAFLTISGWGMQVAREKVYPAAILVLTVGLAVQVALVFKTRQQACIHFWKRSLPVLGAMVLILLTVIRGGNWLREKAATDSLPPVSAEMPNVVFIVVDALRADHLSISGYERQTTPYLDELASQGVWFPNAYSTSNYSLPAHASLLTGLCDYEHLAEWEYPQTMKTLERRPLAEIMQSLGYRTAGFSANVYWVTHEQGFDRGFLHYEDYFHSPQDMFLRTFWGRVFEKVILQRFGFEEIPARKHADGINQAVLQWAGQAPEQASFIFINYMDAHDPYLPPQPFRSMFSSQGEPGGILNWRVGRDDPEMSAGQVQAEIDAYDGAIAYVDNRIQQLITGLKEIDPTRETLVVVTSDHGEAFGEHGMFLHANSLHREVIHVPLVISWPGKLPAGAQVSRPVSNKAIAATVIELVTGQPTSFPGPSLASLWLNPATAQDWPAPLVEVAQQDWQPDKFPITHGWMRSRITPQWQYIDYETLDSELYAWPTDPGEGNNLAGQPSMYSVLADFEAQFGDLLGQVHPYETQR